MSVSCALTARCGLKSIRMSSISIADECARRSTPRPHDSTPRWTRTSNFQGWADKFRDQWPIFKAAEIRRKRVRQVSPDRRKCSEHYRAVGINRAPPCYYERHVDANELCALEWPHTLEAV